MLRALRVDHGVSMDALRKALHKAEKTLQIERLMLSQELRTEAGRMLLERYGELIELSASGQTALRHMFNEYLARVQWDAWRFPVRLDPFSASMTPSGNRPIAIDMQISFGRPVLVSRGVSTSAIAERIRYKPNEQVARHAEATEQGRALERARDAVARDAVRGHGRDVLAVKTDRAAAGRVHAGDAIEQRGLACAVGTDQRNDCASSSRGTLALDRDGESPVIWSWARQETPGSAAQHVGDRLSGRDGRHP